MKSATLLLLASALCTPVWAADPPAKPAERQADKSTEKSGDPESLFQPDAKSSDGSVTIGGRRIDYQAIAGTLVVHPKGWDDAPQTKEEREQHKDGAEASLFYIAYFAKGAPDGRRPVTFVFNGGPGSCTVWLHMGAFGPRRVVTADDQHTPPAPYPVVNNEFSLLDASDLVFIDAPGAGFSRIAGKDAAKSFYGVDQDGEAFANFISRFLSKYNRWNSPKYLFGESYGTTRAAVVTDLLAERHAIDLNGVILLSQILSFDNSVDGTENNPGVDQSYALALPTYAATAWYHKKLEGTARDLGGLLKEVEHFALNDYMLALAAGSTLDPAQRDAIAARLHAYTGLPVAYIKKANLRVDGGEFEKTLQDESGTTTGRLDTRFSGPTLDPLSKSAEYDPEISSIASAYVAAFNDYVRRDLHYGENKTYKLFATGTEHWDFKHSPPGADEGLSQSANVMPDLAHAMKANPLLHVQLNAGYYDLATPYFEGVFEMHHLPIPARLQGNIEFRQYESGHMVYAHEASLRALHDNVADFIRRTDNLK